MKIGYARTSTIEQAAGFEAQLKRLQEAGCQKVFKEQVSSVGERAQLQSALEFIREGDTLVVTKLDRLARSTGDLLRINEAVEKKGARLRILDLDLDTSTATGRLLLTMVGAIAAFERDLMLERQKEGIAAAKAAGKYKGRKATAKAKAAQVLALKKDGVGPSEISRRLGIGRASVYRILDTHG
jgi:DNA invertase Pin-like site-specific DNA recombinase